MSRGGPPNYTYTVPTGTAAVSGATISSAAYNNFLADLAATLNSALPVNLGGSGTTDGSSLLPDGTAGEPSVRWQNSPTTGFYRVSADKIGISIAGVSSATIDETGFGTILPFIVTNTISSVGNTSGFIGFQTISLDASADPGPVVSIYRDSPSPAASDLIGQITFDGQNTTPSQLTYASVTARIDDATPASEDGSLVIATMIAGALVTAATIANGSMALAGWLSTAGPVTKTGTTSTVGATDSSIIYNASGSHTTTLPAATGTNAGRWLHVKSIAAQTIISASSNVVPRNSATAGTALLASGAGNWASLQSNGTNWVVMAGS